MGRGDEAKLTGLHKEYGQVADMPQSQNPRKAQELGVSRWYVVSGREMWG